MPPLYGPGERPMTTISESSTYGIYLNAAHDTNPVVIQPGVSITYEGGDAVAAYYGNWTIVHAGYVANFGYYGSSIYLGGGGGVTNEAAGVIAAPASTLSAIYITGGSGSVTNYGKINAGIWLEGGGGVVNASGGTITSTGTYGGYGVGLYDGGTVTNAGIINGSLVGIDGSHYGATVINESGGMITGAYVGVMMGVIDSPGPGGRYVTNQTGGTISGDTGVLSGYGTATVVNAGLITGTFAGTVSNGGITLVVGAGVSLGAGGSVINEPGGSIS